MITDFSTRVIAPEHVLVQEIEGQSAVLNVQTERYFGLDDVATRMWAVLTTTNSMDDACAKLGAEYDVDSDQLRNDVAQFVEQLSEHDLVRLETPADNS